jgi:hypothetical protein
MKKNPFEEFTGQKEPLEQIYARIPRSLHTKIMAIRDAEKKAGRNLSVYQATEIAFRLFVQYYENKGGKL